MVFCHANAHLLVQQIDFNQPYKFSHIYSIMLPQNFEINGPCLTLSSNMKNVIVSNLCGLILNYELNLGIKSTQQMSCAYTPCRISHAFIDDDDFTSDDLSLEQQKQLEAEQIRKMCVQKRKTEILEIIAKLKNEFIEIKHRNSQLPEQFRLDETAFEIDKRITEDLEQKTQQKFHSIQIELQRKIDRIRHQAERMEHLYLDNLEHWPVILTGFRYVIQCCLQKSVMQKSCATF